MKEIINSTVRIEVKLLNGFHIWALNLKLSKLSKFFGLGKFDNNDNDDDDDNNDDDDEGVLW